MNGEDTTFRDELRDIETGWVPWVLAAAYFPVYILLDFTVGDLAAERLALPQSVAVGVVSLTISSFVVVLFVLVNVLKAARRRRHGLGASRGRVGRRVGRLAMRPVTPITGAVLTVFVVTRDGVAMLLAGLWSAVARIGGYGYLVLALLVRPFVVVAALVTRPVLAAASGIAGIVRRDSGTSADELEEPVDRRRLEGSTSPSPLQRQGATADDPADGGPPGDGPAADGSSGDGSPGDDAPEGEPGRAGSRDGAESDDVAPDDVPQDRVEATVGQATGEPDSSGARATDDDPPSGPERAPAGNASGPEGSTNATDPDERSDGSADTGEESIADPDEEEWPDDWISASDV